METDDITLYAVIASEVAVATERGNLDGNKAEITTRQPLKALWLLALVMTAIGGPLFAAVPDGYVVRVDGKTIYLDWGQSAGVKPGDRFEAYHPGVPLKHPVTGEVLGTTEQALGSGTLDTIEPKFSIGHLDATENPPLIGDRVRWQASGSSTPSPTSALPGGLHERWRSDPLSEEAVSLTIGDLLGDGQNEIVLASADQIDVFRLNEQHLVPVATFNSRYYRHFLAVDTADLKHESHDEIFATYFEDGINRPHVLVLRLEGNTLRKVGEFAGFVRGIERGNHTYHLYAQDLSRSRELNFTPAAEIIFEKGAYQTGATVPLHLEDNQLFGYVWGDWDGDQQEDWAHLDNGGHLHVTMKDKTWDGKEVYGGGKNQFVLDQTHIGMLFPRLFQARPQGALKDDLVVPHNIPELGSVQFTYGKRYKNAEVVGLRWDGQQMAPVWKQPVDGYLADLMVENAPPPSSTPVLLKGGDVKRGDSSLSHTTASQLLAAVVISGHKTILIRYDLP